MSAYYEPRPGSRVAVALRDLLHIVALAEDCRADECELRRMMRDSYHWGERYGYPYKAWLKARTMALERFRKTAPWPTSQPYVSWAELDEWLSERGFREVPPPTEEEPPNWAGELS